MSTSLSPEFPITAAQLLTVAGAATLIYVLTAILKTFLGDKRLTQGIAMLVGVIIVFIAALVQVQWDWGKADYLGAGLIVLFGIFLATFGHEAVSNMLGYFGVGDRSDETLELKAKNRLLASGFTAVQSTTYRLLLATAAKAGPTKATAKKSPPDK